MRRRSLVLSTAAAALLAGGPGWADNFIPKAPGSDKDKKTPAKKKTGRKKSTKPARTPDPTAKAVADLVAAVMLAEVLAMVSPEVNLLFGDMIRLARGYAKLALEASRGTKNAAGFHKRLSAALTQQYSILQSAWYKRWQKDAAKLEKDLLELGKSFDQEHGYWQDVELKTTKQQQSWKKTVSAAKAAQSKAKAGARKGGFRTGQLRYDPKTGWHGGIEYGKQKITYDKTSKRWKGEGNLKPVARKLSWAEETRRKVKRRLVFVRGEIDYLKDKITMVLDDLASTRSAIKLNDAERARLIRLLKDPSNYDTNAKANALDKKIREVMAVDSRLHTSLKKDLRTVSKLRAKYEAALREEMRLEATLKDLAKQK